MSKRKSEIKECVGIGELYSQTEKLKQQTADIQENNNKISKRFWTGRHVVIIWATILILVLITILSTLLTTVLAEDQIPIISPNETTSTFVEQKSNMSSNNPSKSNDYDLQIINRKEWRARTPKTSPIKLQTLPASYVIICHTVSSVCFDKKKCTQYVRNIQDYHMFEKGWNDIGYNFLVGGDGNIYEGRGWDVEGAHSGAYYNTRSIGISFIGDFNVQEPTNAQLAAASNLLLFGEENNKLAKNYMLLGHKQVRPTLSPGNNLYEIIKT